MAIAECEEMSVHVEEAKGILRLFPIWVASLIYAIVFAQVGTLFTKQASTLDRSMGKVLDVPAAALQSFGGVTIIAFIPVYDRAIVPLARRLTRLPSGITMLQRIGAGIAVAVVTMAAAAAVEGRRLVVARERGVVDDLGATVPMRTCGGSCRSTC
jgi:solute carrier family 15 (peptide/histidine transporter), member 3/4